MWAHLFFQRLDLTDPGKIVEELERSGWPLIADLKKTSLGQAPYQILQDLTEQIFSIASALPSPPPLKLDVDLKARLWSALMRAEGVTPSLIEIETPLTYQIKKEPIPLKPEEMRPKIHFSFDDGEVQDHVALVYDPYREHLPEPMGQGTYVVRFEPARSSMPLHIRLRAARAELYPHTEQPFSYEADLLINHADSHTLSMNQVYESLEGFRFFLSNMSPLDESQTKKVGLAVNYDPFKYFLTYPGGIILTLGIILLLLKKQNHI